MTPVLLAMALQALPSPQLDRWRDFMAPDGQQYAIDPQSITRSGKYGSVVVRVRMHKPRGASTGVIRYRYDCEANTVTREPSDVYDEAGHFRGTVSTQQPTRPVRPASLHAALRDRVCGTAAQ